jgi:hypothetical protein
MMEPEKTWLICLLSIIFTQGSYSEELAASPGTQSENNRNRMALELGYLADYCCHVC